MYRIRFHGRGGQGIKTASRILGTAFFREGFEVQDAPRYGAERRGAPIFAFVRAGRGPINERGVILRPDLVVVADDTLTAVPAAGVLQGVEARSVLLIDSAEAPDTWRRRLNVAGPILTLPPPAADEPGARPFAGTACAAAAARLVGVISEGALSAAIEEELAPLGPALVARNLVVAREAFARMAPEEGLVRESPDGDASTYERPRWVELRIERAAVAAPAIHAPLTSVQVRTGLWRTLRPVIDESLCKRCWWVCSTFCPDDAIAVLDDGRPRIDYDHCKGCLICVAQCPPHAIRAVPEALAAAEARA